MAETTLSDKEKISKEIDTTTKRIDEKIEQVLDEILPEAFAIMKDTARRFTEFDTVEVTANDFDRNLAAHKDFVTIEDDKAIYQTHWIAGGNDLSQIQGGDLDIIAVASMTDDGIIKIKSKKVRR